MAPLSPFSGSLMKFIALLLLLLLLLSVSCAPAPRGELQAARMAVSRAYQAGAAELAPEEYQRAIDTLRHGEELLREQNFRKARILLPEVESHARHALARVQLEKERLHRLRLEEEEQLSQARLTPPPQTPRPAPSPPPASPAAHRPKQPSASAPSPAPPAISRYTVGDGENLWSVSAREDVYGDPLLWPLLYQANRDQIRDPRRLYRGQILTIPRAFSAGEMEDAREKARRSDIFPLDRNRPHLPRHP